MTNEEAINVLMERYRLCIKEYPDVKDYAEALEKAIEALRKENEWKKLALYELEQVQHINQRLKKTIGETDEMSGE